MAILPLGPVLPVFASAHHLYLASAGAVLATAIVLSLIHERTTARPALEQGLFDGVIFYSNLLQQDMADDLYDGLVSKGKLPVLALRTVAGGLVAKDGSTPEEAKVAGKLERLRALAREHGCADLVELSVRFALSQPWMLTTIGGTRNAKHLRRFLDLAASGKPLPAAAVRAIEALRREP